MFRHLNPSSNVSLLRKFGTAEIHLTFPLALGYIVICRSREQEYAYTGLQEERNTLNERSGYELKIKEM